MESGFLWHTQEIDSVVHELKTDLGQGLSNKEAESRLTAYGPNELLEPGRISWGNILLRQNISLMIPFLLIALVLLLFMWWSNSDMKQLISAIAVLCFLITNVILSSFEEIKSEKYLCYLRNTARNSIYAKVLRNGHLNPVKITELVPGDIICFSAGDRIPADGRLIETKELAVDESVFTGIPKPVDKNAVVLSKNVHFRQRKNMVFMGSMVTGGSGRAIVTATGAQTQIAQKPMDDTQTTEGSMLESEILGKGLWFAGGCIVFSAIFWGVMELFDIKPLLNGAIISLSFLIAIWPMGMIETVKMVLLSGMKKLRELQIVVRRLSGAELLANITTLCSNKKGIMTQNQVSVRKVFVDGHVISIDNGGHDSSPSGFPPSTEDENLDLPLLLTTACMCTNTEVKNTSEGWIIDGDLTEGALIITAMKGGISKDELGLSLTRVAEIPYDPERKRMSVVFKDTNSELFVFTRGPLEAILDICDNIQLHGYVESLDIGRDRAIWAVNQSFTRDSMQTMAFAYRPLRETEGYTPSSIERDLIFVGMMGIIDLPRADAKLAVKKCLAGTIKPILFTDDCKDTAFSFARNVGIANNEAEVLTGEELDILGEKEFFDIYNRFSVYADISPTHKLRIIRTLREGGETTAMIGGSLSDAPVVAEADVGIATGRTGSSVSIEASDIVLMDDSFTTAVSAIEGTRGILRNARRIVRYFLSGSLAIACTILIALIIRIFWENFLFPPLSFLHVLWINLVAISIPAIAIIFTPLTDDAIEAYTRGGVSSGGLWSNILIRGILTAVFALIAYAFSFGPRDLWSLNQDRAGTVALTILVMSQLAFAFQCCCATNTGFFRKFFTNKLLLGLAFLAILLHVSIIYVPFINTVLGTKPLSLVEWIPILIAFAIFSLPLDELFATHVEYEEEIYDKKKDITEESVQEDSDKSVTGNG